MTPTLTTRIAAHRARLNDRLAMIAKATEKPWRIELASGPKDWPRIVHDIPVSEDESPDWLHISDLDNCITPENAALIAAARTGWEESIKNELVALDALECVVKREKYAHSSNCACNSCECEHALLTILDRAEAQS